ncbi:ABC transporter B family member 12 [Hibiscus syriacus]|uniref:ABC transporter B family member 12 n=1 Tax=Hibiscus syriacus TaxID=106335 RepID=A0A6A3CXM1_HIBSY|nr:ABC transporter B family member 12 [Hibiscus syriacus]
MREEKDGSTRLVPYYRLFSFADSMDYVLMLVGSVSAVGNGVCMPVMTIFFGQLVDSVGKSMTIATEVHEVTEVSLKFVYLAVASAAASFFQVASWMVTGERQAARIRSLYLKAILSQDIAFFDDEINGGEVMGRMSGDTVLIRDAIGEKVGSFIQQAAAFTGGFVIALLRGWLLTLVLLSSIPPLVISGAILHKLVGKFSFRGQASYSLSATVAERTISSIRTVASFAGEKQAIAKYNKSLSRAYKAGVQESLVSGLGFGTLMCILFCSYGFAFWYGGKMILEKGYTAGTVINVIFAVVISSLSLGVASTSLSAFAAGQAAAFKMFEIIERKPMIDAYCTKGRKLHDILGEIELRDVHFSYPARPKELILKGLSLSIRSGKTTALVGHSGSGKSTVISLIERFYDPLFGEIFIDGFDLKTLQLRWIRQKIGLVSQEPVLFASSIRDNIAYGRDDASSDDIMAAAMLANAAKFIFKLPQGLDTMVGEQGIQLSGGQKQRIAIARAVLKDPRILLLDEATSALDGESERTVQEALERAMINRTVVVVSHRLTTIRNADFIAVIHHGMIVERGSHAELLKNRNGLYTRFLRLQENSKELQREITTVRDSSHISPQSIPAPFHLSVDITKHYMSTPKPTMEILEKRPPQVPLSRLVSINSSEIPALLLGAVLAMANGVILPIFGTVLSGIIKTFSEQPHELNKDSRFWALMFVALGVASLLCHSLSTYLFAIAGCKLIQRVRSMCFEKVVNMDIGWFDEPQHSSGVIGTRLSTDAVSVRRLVGDSLAIFAQSAATGVAGLVIAFQANWQLALAILVLLPLIGISGYAQIKSMKGFTASAKKMYEEANQVANEAVGSIRTVASFCGEMKVVEQYEKKCEAPLKTGIRHGLISGIGLGISSFSLFLAYAISFYVGAHLVHHGKTTFHQVFFALSVSAIGISQSNSLAPDVGKAKVSVASIFEILDQRSKIDPSQNSGKMLKRVKGDIQFKHVSFRYPTRPELKIFRDLSLTIRTGKTVALVGESGSGKSTFISLLLRFYEPNSGHITLDGVEISKLQLRWLREQIGIVSQEPVLFNDTIRANIAYGKSGNATDAEIKAAAELANAHNFIRRLQQGYDSVVGERGIHLSGGQKQRVAIARAVIRAPKILLLDEATSALDAESERAVQEALEQVTIGRTTVVVSHRLSTIKGSDLIAVIRNGVIVEKGRHETLMQIKGGFYASLMAPGDKM